MNYQKIYETSTLVVCGSEEIKVQYTNDPVGFLTSLGITDAEEQKTINELIIPADNLRQRQISTFNLKTDYNKKMQALFNLVYDPAAAAFFEANPQQFLNNQGVFMPDEQQQVYDLLIPVRELQQLMIKNREAGMDYTKNLTCLSKLLNSPEDQKAYMANPNQYLAANEIVNPQDQDMIINLLHPAQAFQKIMLAQWLEQKKEIDDVNTSYRVGLSKSNYQTIKGFQITMIMYTVSFYIGIALLIAAVVFAMFTKSSLYAILFGSIGTLDLLTFFIAKPPLNLQESRSEQAKLNAAFYSWFLDLYNWNSFYVQYSGKGQTIDFDVMKKVSDAQIDNTKKLMELISNNIKTSS